MVVGAYVIALPKGSKWDCTDIVLQTTQTNILKLSHSEVLTAYKKPNQ